MDKNKILAILSETGRCLTIYADPDNYSYEYRKVARFYKSDVILCKQCYENIRNDYDINTELKKLIKNLKHTREKNKLISNVEKMLNKGLVL